MTEILLVIFSAVVQALTEFLPVSSSGHLVLIHDFLNLEVSDDIAFDVVLHLGTLLALVLYFYKDLWQYFLAFIRSIQKRKIGEHSDRRIAWYLLVTVFPAALVGFFFEEFLEYTFRYAQSVAIMLILFGVILYVADRYAKKEREIKDLTLPGVILIGLFQILALIPGVSRSGITIIAGLSQKLKRGEAARFSFLMAVPIVFAAGGKKVFSLIADTNLTPSDMVAMFLGFIVSAFVGYLVIALFLKFLQKHSLAVFAFYRIILGLAILLLLYLQ